MSQISGYGNASLYASFFSGIGSANSANSNKGFLATETLAQMDTNGDGQVSEAEFKAAMEKNAPAGADMTKVDAMADKLFKKIDTDGSGEISTAEWTNFQQKISSGGGGHHHHHHAQSADSDDSTSSTSQTQSLVNALFQAADTNNDGVISKDEMTALLTKFTDAMAGSASDQTTGTALSVAL